MIRKLLATLAVAASFAAVAAPAADAHISVTNVPYDIFKNWCGGYSPWHDSYWETVIWTCSDRKQQLYINAHYDSQGFDKITYCYVEDKPGAWAQRCIRSNIRISDGALLSYVYWTNSSS